MIKTYYERLKDLRIDNNLVQKEVAAYLGIDQRVYLTYETGVRALPIDHLIKLCEYYNVSSDWVLGLKNSMRI